MTAIDMAAMYQEYRKDVRDYLYRHGGRDPHLAEDLTQDVFVRALRTAAGYTDRGKPRAWLYTIAQTVLLDHWKRASTRYQVPVDMGAGFWSEPLELALDGPEVEVLGALNAAEVRQALNAAIADLTPAQQRVVRLRFYEELSSRDTAAATGRNEPAVRVLQSRACRRLARDERLLSLRTGVAA